MTLRWSNGHRSFIGLTDLNRFTNAAYARCLANGGHIAGGETVRRWFPGSDRELQVCARCQVPMNAPKANWSSGTSRPRGPKLPGPLPTARDGERYP